MNRKLDQPMPEVNTTLWTSEFTNRFSFRLMATSAIVAAAVACGEVERDDVASIARRAARRRLR
jgi:hypothetical protein